MTVRGPSDKIDLHLDKERILEIVGSAYDTVVDTLGVEPYRSRQRTLDEARSLVEHGITLQFTLDLSSKKMDDLRLRVDPRTRKVLCLSPRFPTLRNRLNGLLRLL